MTYPRYLAVPFRIGKDGRTAQPADFEQHVHEELMQLILTNLGERLFQPEFGTNVRRLVIAYYPLAPSSTSETSSPLSSPPSNSTRSEFLRPRRTRTASWPKNARR